MMEQHEVSSGEEEVSDYLLASATTSTAGLQSTFSMLLAFPCPPFGFGMINPMDLSALQNQSHIFRGNVGQVEASAMSPSLTDQGALQNMSADECLSHSRHGSYPQDLHKMKPHGEKT